MTSTERRRARRAHRRAARFLIASGTLFNAKAKKGSTPYSVATWHLKKARRL